MTGGSHIGPTALSSSVGRSKRGANFGWLSLLMLLVTQSLYSNPLPNIDPLESKQSPQYFDRLVWFADMSHRLASFVDDPEQRRQILDLVFKESKRTDIAPSLLLAVIHVESDFQRFAVSSAGALGYMQVMPFWKTEIGKSTDNLLHPETNIFYGASILRRYLDREKGNIRRALARYNGSLGKQRYPNKVLNRLNRYWTNEVFQ